MDKELNLIRDQLPSHSNLYEHFCRRWPALGLQEKPPEFSIVAHRAVHCDSGDSFLCFTMGRPALPVADRRVSVTLGLFIDEDLLETMRFAKDPALDTRVVGHTCERCGISDCRERAAPPAIFEARERHRQTREALEALNDS